MSTKTRLRRPLTGMIWRFRQELVVVVAFSFVANLLMLTPTLYMLQIFDRVMVSRSEFTLLAASALALLFLLVMAVADSLRSQLLVRAGVRFDEAVHARVFHALFDRALDKSSNNPAQGLQNLQQLRQFLTGPGAQGLLDLPWMPVYIFISWLLHPVLGLISLAFALVIAVLGWWSHYQQAPLAHRQMVCSRETTSYVQSKLRHADAVESMGMLRGLRSRWQELRRKDQAEGHELEKTTSLHKSVQHFVQYTQQSLVLAAGAWLVVRGELSLGAMIAANVLMSRALQPMQVVSSSWKSYFSAREAFVSLNELMEQHPARTGISMSHPPKGLLQLVGVSATAQGREARILDSVDLECKPGELTVILGASGSGKSTLARCMLGIWPGMTGSVLLDGEPIGAWDRQELGPYLGFLPQDVQLMAGSVAENIARLGPLDPDEVVRAAKAAGIHELILRLPAGYDTTLDVFATELSAGHRQRLGLARALYGDPALVLLDEPNSNLDDAGEIALFRALDALRKASRTVVVITHRGRLIQAADRIVLLEGGRVRMQGPRDTVLRHLSELRGKPSLTTKPFAAKEAP